MNNHYQRLAIAGALAATLAVLGACGGSDDTPAATSQVPADASTSVGGFIAYLQALVVSQTDTLEPVDVSMVTPPVDDTGDPAPLN